MNHTLERLWPKANETSREDQEIAAMGLVRELADLNMTGDVIEDDGEVYKHEREDDDVDRLIKQAREIVYGL